MKTFKVNTKFRVVSGRIHFYTTAKQIRNGVGDSTAFNDAVRSAFIELERSRNGTGLAEQCTTGLAGRWSNIDVQLDLID